MQGVNGEAFENIFVKKSIFSFGPIDFLTKERYDIDVKRKGARKREPEPRDLERFVKAAAPQMRMRRDVERGF